MGTKGFKRVSLSGLTLAVTLMLAAFAGPNPAAAQGSNTGIDLDGTNDYASAPDTASLRNMGNCTVEAWIKPDSGSLGAVGGKRVIISKRKDVANGGGYELRITEGKTLYFATFDNSGNVKISITSVAQVSEGVWTHVAGWYNASAYTIGCSVGGSTLENGDGTGTGSPAAGTTNLQIGRYNSAAGAVHYFKGDMDEIRLSNVARYGATNFTPQTCFTSDGNTAALYHCDEASGTTLDDASSNSNDATLQNGTARTVGVSACP